VQECFSLDNKPKENDMSKRGRKRRDRRKNGANHGKRPNARPPGGAVRGPAAGGGGGGGFVYLRAHLCVRVGRRTS